MAQDIQLEASWLAHLGAEFDQPYMKKLSAFLQAEKKAGKVIYPESSEVFSAFEHTPLDQVKVVILGQDPYHGLCFSVRPGIATPPSLLNIYKEIHAEFSHPIPNHGYLTSWADQGVLLLNSVLTVEATQAASHQKHGWEEFTDRAIDVINREKEGVVFLLWGAYAQRKGSIIDTKKHRVLTAPHPSPLSAHRGFLGCGHFKATNKYLKIKGSKEIDWRVPDIADSQYQTVMPL